MDFQIKEKYTINDLLEIVKLLRGENGCPWDKEQTHKSIRKNIIEETYEVCEAIDKDDALLLKEELGDVLLQVVFHTQMEDEISVFNFDDVANDICQKLIIRHPHVFSDTAVNSVSEVLDNWASIKKQTKGQITVSDTLSSVPHQLPALMRSQKVIGRAQKANKNLKPVNSKKVLDELKSEIDKLEKAMDNNDMVTVTEEMGDVLFKAVNVSRCCNVDAEEVLSASCDRFIGDFLETEESAK